MHSAAMAFGHTLMRLERPRDDSCFRPRLSPVCHLLLAAAVSGGFLSPDEVTFAVLLRGHGAADPPAWQQMDAVLNKMQGGHGITPSAGGAGSWGRDVSP